MNKLPEKDFIHTEAFKWCNSEVKASKENHRKIIVIDGSLGIVGYVAAGCTFITMIMSLITGFVVIFG